ncbi:MAG: DUF4209 domain-containing protein [Fimbriimonadaceae bacterium]|nr:MAG: DUF4209 domain-containing protein [Fimbriimonadaceae bacterium]
MIERLPLNELVITLEDLQNCGWEAILKTARTWELERIYTDFFNAANRAAAEENHHLSNALVVLGSAASLYISHAKDKDPLGIMFIGNGMRSPAITDFSDDQLALLDKFLQHVDNNELKSRIADIIWIRNSNYAAARIASAAYLSSTIEHLNDDSWVTAISRLERSFAIASKLGRRSPEFQAVTRYTEHLLLTSLPSKSQALGIRLINLLLDYKCADLQRIGNRAILCAEDALQSKDFFLASDFYAVARKIFKRSKSKEGLLSVTESYVSACVAIANSFLATPGNRGAAQHWLQCAIDAVNQVGTLQDLKSSLVNQLYNAQKIAMEDMTSMGIPYEINSEMKEILDQSKSVSFQDFLALIALHTVIHSKSELEKLTLESNDKDIFLGMVDFRIVGDGGQTSAIIPGLPIGEETPGDLLEKKMWHTSNRIRIVPATHVSYLLAILNEKFDLEAESFDWLLENNVFVKENRKGLFEIALRSGLKGELEIFAHLIVPQLEESIRQALKLSGETVTYIKPDGTEDVMPMQDYMRRPAFPRTFGEDFAFELRGLLVERTGSNLRNELSHGLLAHQSFYGANIFFLLGITIKILLQGRERTDDTS